ncbi:LacI family DNA-binding transcriptional regulator [Paraburkholderia pallida]|uniref:LacI family DNA-binding transcriptional regulator n=1 Tax=Paraburkholderia pallida TaxID=2547399 RepID=A0A4P7D2J6_9BURK|nr:LacI family DNA-binding transcriptional regulator [Paraburkholderia pallida]QBR00970.1 LacI family DNA-binding transcriptional regulator [Paraburkholderia pallida]
MQSPAPPKPRPTIADVARAAGVSTTTVSHALNDKGYVDPQTRQRVKDVARELGYRPSVRAQRLRTGEARTIALISSMPFEIAGGASRLGFLMEVAAVAAAAALTRGLALVLVPPVMAGRLPLEQLDIDGAIVIEPTADDANVTHLQERGLPVVCLGRLPGNDAVPYVDIHSFATTALLLRHLHEQGSRQIALLIGAQQRNSYAESRAAYERFCAEHGMTPVIAVADEAGGEEAGREACAALLQQHPQLDGLCALVDAFAVGAVQGLADAGRRVPGDVRIATRYDGIRARSCRPPLTAVDLHLDEMASQAVALLFDHLAGKGGAPSATPADPSLVIRESSVADAGDA